MFPELDLPDRATQAPEHRIDSRGEFFHVERLRDVVVGTEVETATLSAF
jgi:hypothetical protein